MLFFILLGEVCWFGYIEFDLCFDFFGEDVVCKLLIFVCYVGFLFNIDEVEVESLVL